MHPHVSGLFSATSREIAFDVLVWCAARMWDVLRVEKTSNITPNRLHLLGLQDPQEEVAQQAIEFWSTVCDEEINLRWEMLDADEQGRAPTQSAKWYAKGALKFLVPILTKLLCQQEETDDEDAWNVATAAGVCISLLANVCGNDIVPVVSPFIYQNMQACVAGRLQNVKWPEVK